MRKWLLSALAALFIFCTPPGQAAELVFQGDAQAPVISPSAEGSEPEQREVSLYYRMRGEDMLARETRQVLFPLDTTVEAMLITKLIEGPGPNLLALTGLFNPGTKVMTSGEGSLLTVVLSSEFLEKPADAPDNWRQDSAWHSEVLTRRRLALLSIVNTVTEETSYTAVQLLVQQDDNDRYGRRIPRAEIYEDGAESVVLSPVTRAEASILSARNTAEIVLSCWREKDYDRLYRFVLGRPTEEEFRQRMLQVDRSLTGFSLLPGVVSNDGQSAVITANIEYRNANGYVQVRDYPIRMVRDSSLWKMDYEALIRLMEAD